MTQTGSATVAPRLGEVFAESAVQGFIGQRMQFTNMGSLPGSYVGVVTDARLLDDGMIEVDWTADEAVLAFDPDPYGLTGAPAFLGDSLKWAPEDGA